MSHDPRPMTLLQQADAVEFVLRAWREPVDPQFAVSPVWISAQEADDLRTIAKTLRILGAHGADEYVRAKVAREKKERGGR